MPALAANKGSALSPDANSGRGAPETTAAFIDSSATHHAILPGCCGISSGTDGLVTDPETGRTFDPSVPAPTIEISSVSLFEANASSSAAPGVTELASHWTNFGSGRRLGFWSIFHASYTPVHCRCGLDSAVPAASDCSAGTEIRPSGPIARCKSPIASISASRALACATAIAWP